MTFETSVFVSLIAESCMLNSAKEFSMQAFLALFFKKAKNETDNAVILSSDRHHCVIDVLKYILVNCTLTIWHFPINCWTMLLFYTISCPLHIRSNTCFFRWLDLHSADVSIYTLYIVKRCIRLCDGLIESLKRMHCTRVTTRLICLAKLTKDTGGGGVRARIFFWWITLRLLVSFRCHEYRYITWVASCAIRLSAWWCKKSTEFEMVNSFCS